jgi:hypothetical protein
MANPTFFRQTQGATRLPVIKKHRFWQKHTVLIEDNGDTKFL